MADAASDVSSSTTSNARTDVLDLPKGSAMTLEDSYDITASTRCRLIVLAGAPKCGKTTLLASLLHTFQKGPFANYWFSGSTTLLGFDQRCHDARTSSNRGAADMERTKAGIKNLLLHLQVRRNAADQPKDLLFLDVSGEDYEYARNSVDECRKLNFIRRADHFVLMIDGARLADINRRQEAKTSALTLLRSCFDSGQLTRRSLVHILISKWDLADSTEQKDALISFVELLEADIRNRFETKAGRLRIFRIAARPGGPELPLAFGLDEVLRDWVEDIPENFQVTANVLPTTMYSEFDRYALCR